MPSWNEIVAEILGLDLAPLLPPQPHEIGFVAAHDNSRVGAADEGAAVFRVESDRDVGG